MWGRCGVGACVLMLFCREWYGYHFPELIKIVSENYTYCRLAKFIGNRKELSEESLEGLEEIVMDGAKAQAILEASRSSMGECGSARPAALPAEHGSLTPLSRRDGHLPHRPHQHRELLQPRHLPVGVPQGPAGVPALQDEPGGPQPLSPHRGGGECERVPPFPPARPWR